MKTTDHVRKQNHVCFILQWGLHLENIWCHPFLFAKQENLHKAFEDGRTEMKWSILTAISPTNLIWSQCLHILTQAGTLPPPPKSFSFRHLNLNLSKTQKHSKLWAEFALRPQWHYSACFVHTLATRLQFVCLLICQRKSQAVFVFRPNLRCSISLPICRNHQKQQLRIHDCTSLNWCTCTLSQATTLFQQGDYFEQRFFWWKHVKYLTSNPILAKFLSWFTSDDILLNSDWNLLLFKLFAR